MSKKTTRRSKFTKNLANGGSYSATSQAHSTSPAVGQWYRGIQELLLYKFIKIVCDGDVRELIISGKPAISDLVSTWNKIYEEFIDGMQGRKEKDRVKLLSGLDKMKYDYHLIQMFVHRLKLGPAEWILDLLRERIRVTGEFNPEDQEGYFRDLQVILNRANKLQQMIQEREAEIKITEEKKPGSVAPSYKQFDILVAQVSVFAKFHINRLTISTSEFMTLYNMMKAHHEALEAAAKHKTKAHGKS